MPARKQNLWPFTSTRKAGPVKVARRSSMTVGEATRAAYRAGQQSGDTGLFSSWLQAHGLEGRGGALRARLSKEYERGAVGSYRGSHHTSTTAKQFGKTPKRKTPDDKNREFVERSSAKAATYKGHKIEPRGESWVIPSIDRESEFDTLQDAKRFLDSWGEQNPARARQYSPEQLAKQFEYWDVPEKHIRVLGKYIQKVSDKFGADRVYMYWYDGPAVPSFVLGEGGTVKLSVPFPQQADHLFAGLHEVAHALLHADSDEPANKEEFEANEFALNALRSEGIAFPDEDRRRWERYACKHLRADRKRGLPIDPRAAGQCNPVTDRAHRYRANELVEGEHVDRGDRGLSSDMGVRQAVDMIRATPQHKRREFAAKLRRRNPLPSPAVVDREWKKENDKRARMGLAPLTKHEFMPLWYPDMFSDNPRGPFPGSGSIEGVNFHAGTDGVVIWSDDWDKLTEWAQLGLHGFSFRSGGPETYGHTDIVSANPSRDDSSLIIQAQTARGVEELGRLHKYAASRGNAELLAAVESRASQLGIRHAELTAAHPRQWNPGASYRGMSVAKLEQIRPHVAVLTVSDDWLERDRGRRELEKVDHALALARKREGKSASNPAGYTLAVSKTLSATPPGSGDSSKPPYETLAGPWNRVSSGAPVEVLAHGSGRGGKNRLLVKADHFGVPYWGWVDKSDLARGTESNPVTHEQGQAAYEAGKRTGSDWRGRFTRGAVRKEFDNWVEYRKNSLPWLQGLTPAERERLWSNFYAGAKWGYDSSPVRNPASRNPEFFVVAPSSGSRPPVSRHYSVTEAEAKRDVLNAKGGDYAVFAADIDTKSRTGYRMHRRNPADGAAALYESFHGKPADQELVIEEEEHEHDHLSVLGRAVDCWIETPTGLLAHIEFEKEPNDPVIVTSAEGGKQLYFTGGDQAVDLGSLKMDGGEWVRDRMVLGTFARPHCKCGGEFEKRGEKYTCEKCGRKVTFDTKAPGDQLHNLAYLTRKDFDKFKPITYEHDLGEETGVRPQLEFDPRSKHLYIAGGQYFIKQPLFGTSPGIEN